MRILQIGQGAMGQLLERELSKEHEVFSSALSKDIPNEKFDAVIDFSHPDNLEKIAEYLHENPTPLVLATTGFTEEQEETIENLAKEMPVLFSYNFSIGVTLMNKLVKEMAKALAKDFDIEIIEKHHNKKLDAPSGTAQMLVNSVNDGLDYEIVHGRSGHKHRAKKEIGVHALRAGTIAGEHEVIFAGEDEILSIKHEAHSKLIFAKGAIRGMNWLINQPTGLYNMENVLELGEKI